MNITEIIKGYSQDGVTLVIDFFTTWCPPCKVLAKSIEAVEPAHKNVKFIKMDIEKNREIAERYDITQVPTLVLIRPDGKQVQYVGAMGETQLSKWIEWNK